ncbi:hypothetical protein C8R43DRAFT_1134166 [Mycena crocata]|nr:hypothetical protein C8R43DRAFT_1134166 [Mycena crocata]
MSATMDADDEFYAQPRTRILRVRAISVGKENVVRCDSADMEDGRCSSCISLNDECTHTGTMRKRGPKNRNAELQELKYQVSALAAKLRHVSPPAGEPGSSSNPPSLPSDKSTPESPSSSQHAIRNKDGSQHANRNGESSRGTIHSESGSLSAIHNTEDEVEDVTERLNAFSLDFVKDRFFVGKNVPPPAEPGQYTFPGADLIADLLLLHFENIHPTLPLLHRPLFERKVKEELHIHDHQFGALLLAHSDDPRVFVPGSNSTMSSGWAFFDQVQVIHRSLREVLELYEVQLYCLANLYVHGSSSPPDAGMYLGLGIRFIQERGKHLRKRDATPTVEGELWNRAFWCLLSLDTTICSFLGRPSAMHVRTEVSEGTQASKQPSNLNMVNMSGPGVVGDNVGIQNHAGTGYADVNMMSMDDEIMSMWIAAPTNFR